MQIGYTYHSIAKIKRRRLEKIWIEDAIKYPDLTKRKGNKFEVIKKINSITIKVIYMK